MKQAFINWLLLSAFALASLGQLGRISLNTTTHFYLFEPVLALAVALLILTLKAKPFKSLVTYRISWSLALFLGWASLSLIISFFWFSFEENTIAAFYFARLAKYLIAVPYLLYWFKKNAGFRKEAAIVIPVMMLFFITSSIVQYIYYPDLRNLLYLGWDPHAFRLFGVYFEPVNLASIAGLFLIFSVVMIEKTKVYVASGVVFLVFIMASFSRAAYVGLAAITVFFISRFLNKKVILGSVAGIVLVAGILTVLPKPSGEGVQLLRTSTIFSRFTDYQEGIRLWQKAPISGIGYNHIGAVKEVPEGQPGLYNNAIASFHSSFLILLVTTGVIGLLLFLNFIWQVMKAHPFFCYSFIYLGAVSLFDNVLLHPFSLITVVFLGGYIVSLPSRT